MLEMIRMLLENRWTHWVDLLKPAVLRLNIELIWTGWNVVKM